MSGKAKKRRQSKLVRSRSKQSSSSKSHGSVKDWEPQTVSSEDLGNDEAQQIDHQEDSNKEEDLTKVNLSQQGLSIFPAYLLERTDIVEFNLSHNNLHQIPIEIKKFVLLTRLDISQNPIHCIHSNDFSGIPLDLSFLQHLRALKISQCNLRYIPTAIWKCRRLHVLDISHNKINVLPPDVGSLTKLRQLNVQYTSITTLPAEIAYCQDLEEILMWGNNVEILPDVLRYLPKLCTIAINFRSFASVIDNYMEGLLKRGQIKSEHLPAVIFEISGMNYLDLEGTKINQLPDNCAGKLRHLILANNFFPEIPKLVLTLDQLSFLDVSGNMIKSVPMEIGILTNLRKLWLNKNEIESLPDSIGSMVALEELSLSQNVLTTLPEKIGKLKALQTLIADHNRITRLPNSIGDLQELVTLDLTGNLLEALPEAMLNMKKLNSAHNYHKFRKHGLWLHKNPLSTPPQAVWKTNDPAKIYNYLKTCQVEKLEHSQRQKLIILGSEQSGKTSLVRTIMAGKSSLTTRLTDRTNLVEFSSWRTKNDVKILIHDTGSDELFRTVLCPHFLDETAFYLIVFNAASYSVDSYYTLVGCWIDMLLLHCPQAVVKVVGTHLDLCSSDSASQEATRTLWKATRDQLKGHRKRQLAEIAKFDKEIEEEEQTDSMDVRRKLRTQRIRLTKAAQKPLQLQRQIPIVSSSEGLQGMEELLSELEMTFLDSTLFPRVRQLVNEKWQTFNQVLKTCPGYYLKWKNVIKLANESDICLKELPECLTHLHNIGKILWHGQLTGMSGPVIHRPRKFAEIMQAIFRSDLPDYLDFSRNKVFMGLGQFTDETFAIAKYNLLTHGQLSWSLLKCLCLCFPQSKEKIDIGKLASIMQQCNLCYIIPHPDVPDNTKEVTPFIVIPSYCVKKSESEVSPVCLEQQSERELEIRTSYTFPTATPTMLFCRLSCRIHSLVEYRYDLSNLIVSKVSNMTVQLSKDTDENIDITVRGAELYDMQAVLDKMEAAMESVIAVFPGLTYRMQRSVLNNLPQDKS